MAQEDQHLLIGTQSAALIYLFDSCFAFPLKCSAMSSFHQVLHEYLAMPEE